MSNKNHRSKIAVITGAARGLGYATAMQLRHAGVTVIGIDILMPEKRRTFNGFFLADMCDLDEIDTIVAQIAEEFGDIDILINNAGVLMLERGEDGIPPSAYRAFDVNFFGPWYLTSALLPGLLRKHGKVVNVSSLLAVVNAPYLASYAASKRALSAYSDVLRMECRGRLDITTVFPGFMDTDIHEPTRAVGLSVKRLVSFKIGDWTLFSLEEKLSVASTKLARIALKKSARNCGLTWLGTLTLHCARSFPSLVDTFITFRLQSLLRSGALELRPELIEPESDRIAQLQLMHVQNRQLIEGALR